MSVTGDFVAAFYGLTDGVGIKPGARGVRANGAGRVEAVERADDAPQTFVAAILAPGNSGVILCTWFQRRRLHRVRRGLALRPGFQKHRDCDRDAFALRPFEFAFAHQLIQGDWDYSNEKRSAGS